MAVHQGPPVEEEFVEGRGEEVHFADGFHDTLGCFAERLGIWLEAADAVEVKHDLIELSVLKGPLPVGFGNGDQAEVRSGLLPGDFFEAKAELPEALVLQFNEDGLLIFEMLINNRRRVLDVFGYFPDADLGPSFPFGEGAGGGEDGDFEGRDFVEAAFFVSFQRLGCYFGEEK